MSGHWTDSFSFLDAAIRSRDIVFVALSGDAAAAEKIAVTNFTQWRPDAWGNGGNTAWRTAGVAIAQYPLVQLIAVGEFGGALLLGSGDRHEELIETPDSSPDNRGPLRGVRRIGDDIIVVGMDRQVYRRTGENAWATFDKGIPRSTDPKVITGFESVDGRSMDDIVAVGWDGDIWVCDHGQWVQQASPVNTVLLSVCCAEDGLTYACGRNGLLIRGRAGQWEVMDQGVFAEDLWSLAWFNGKLYASSMDAVYVLEDGELGPVYMGEDQAKTCFRLTAGDGVLWSIGAKDLMCFDGTAWTRID
ncbi:MAG: hypothetical protein RLZZ618_1031 [Pseudomonadota bacterium]|jgi:hypothetical protein